MHVFFIVLARDAKGVKAKVEELERFHYPYVVVCGEKTGLLNVVYRPLLGKYDAINFGSTFIPPDTDIVVLNDVDTEIHNFEVALAKFQNENVSLVFTKVNVGLGPQLSFYSLLDSLRKRIPIAASGELMLVKCQIMRSMLPLRGCKAEDTYILFKILEKGEKVGFCEKCYVTTKRTTQAEQEEAYKRRTVGGIYQALSMSRPPLIVRLFYTILPFMSPLLLILGKKGFYWTKGILSGYIDYRKGDRTASWRPTYT